MRSIHYTHPYNNTRQATLDEDGNSVLENIDDYKFADAKKEILSTGEEVHYVKVIGTGRLYNPYTTQAENQTRANKLLYKDGSSRFVKVSKSCFDYYLKFLVTRSVIYLKSAEGSKL